MVEQNQQLLSSISQEDWSEIYTRLLFYAYKRYHHLAGMQDLDLHDIVQQAIADTLQGTRRWSPRDSEKGEVNVKSNLFIFLCGVVDSKISHEKEKRGRFIEVRGINTEDVSQLADEQEHGEVPIQKLRIFISHSYADNEVVRKELINRVRELVAEDPELRKVVDVILDDPDSKPKEMAKQLGFSTTQMYAALKRLRRCLSPVKEELRNG